LFPALVSAYDAWTVGGHTRELQAITVRAAHHWQSLALDLLDIFSRDGPDCRQALVGSIEHNTY